MKHAILCVDDEIDNVEALERLFRKKYRVLKATSGSQALDILADEDVALIISDQRMPRMTGVDFLERSIELRPDAVRILLTGYTDIESVVAAINSGQIYRYVTKPWDSRELSAAVDRAVERFELTQELKEKNKALESALAELQTLDTAKNHFMILINHELKTPLTSLLSFLELLKETSLDDEQTKFVDRVETSALRLKEIIMDVLELVSAETGQTSVRREKISSKEICKKAADSLKKLAEEKKQKIVLPSSGPQVHADSKIISNVLQRILHNAIKFGEKGTEIEISCEKSADDRVYINIRNEGKPISKAAIDRIMKPFTLDEDIMNHSKGLGLGLSLCQALLRRHSTKLEIKSEQGHTLVGFGLDPA
ncbi:MAG TPA: hybrid sensor histidine kinase/response regulator [Bdellovibrionales bacterium]|nr:hybrid sensor histidine kinase/response regulator [Bdellovibrionales bacterium]